MSDVGASTSPPPDCTPALHGLLVLELGSGLATVLGGMLLADNGARVIKVEPPSGSADRARAGHRVWNRGKQSICLDLHRPHHSDILEHLLARADIALWDATERIVLDSLLEHYPRLINGVVSGYGSNGPLADAPVDDA